MKKQEKENPYTAFSLSEIESQTAIISPKDKHVKTLRKSLQRSGNSYEKNFNSRGIEFCNVIYRLRRFKF